MAVCFGASAMLFRAGAPVSAPPQSREQKHECFSIATPRVPSPPENDGIPTAAVGARRRRDERVSSAGTDVWHRYR